MSPINAVQNSYRHFLSYLGYNGAPIVNSGDYSSSSSEKKALKLKITDYLSQLEPQLFSIQKYLLWENPLITVATILTANLLAW